TPRLGKGSHTITSRSESRYGKGCKRTVLTTLKTAVLAPIPKASATSATMVTPRPFNNARQASFKTSSKVSIERPPGNYRQNTCSPRGRQSDALLSRRFQIRCHRLRAPSACFDWLSGDWLQDWSSVCGKLDSKTEQVSDPVISRL